MIKWKKLVQVAASLTICVMMPVGVTCNAALIPCDKTVDSSVAEKMGETLVEGTCKIQKDVQEELRRIELERLERERLERERLERERLEQERLEREHQEELKRQAEENLAVQKLLASIIFCEAGNQPYEGQVAVGAVVMNRVESEIYPNSVEEVIYQSGQFGPAVTGWLDQVRACDGYTPETFQAALDAMSGSDPVEGCLYFDQGGYGIQIGAHYFH